MAEIYLTILAISSIALVTGYKFPFQNPTLSWDSRVDDLVGRLSLEDIAQQTLAIYGSHTPAIPKLGIKPYVWITECLRGQEKTNTTAFPQALGLAAAFSPDIIMAMAEAISFEVRAHWNANSKRNEYLTGQGLSCFSPVINIMRHPLWGRNQETYGEDPFLSGTLAQAYVHGLQGNHPRYLRANAGCKHFDVHGGPENIPVTRFSFDARVSNFDWRMTFLPQFKMCVDAGSYNLMCSYNRLNGIPACANKELLTSITRNEWGFNGYIVSDAGAVENIIKFHKYLNNSVDTATASIKAGCNLELGSKIFLSQVEAVKEKKLTEAEVRANVKPLFYTRMRLGEFDPPKMNPYNGIDMAVVQSKGHRQLALKAALKSFVLLKNSNGFLPMKQKASSIAVIGPFVDNASQLYGDYGSKVVPPFVETPKSTLGALGEKATFANGCDKPSCTKYNSLEIKKAVVDAKVVFVCLGLGQDLEAESNDRKNLNLPGKQLVLLQDAAKYNPNAKIVLLLFNAGPLDVTWAKNNAQVSAILACFYPAQSTGDALYQALTATNASAIPSGRLPATWPAGMNQVPPMSNYTMKGRTYRYYMGDPLYPFGYGLSYSSFQYSKLTASPSHVKPGNNVTIQVTVENTGPYESDEVVQVYMTWPTANVPKNITAHLPKYQLVAFKRLALKVNQPTAVNFNVTADQMKVWVEEKSDYLLFLGQYKVFVGGQQPGQATKATSNILSSVFNVM